METHTIILQRSGEDTTAIVTCSSDLKTNNEIMRAIQKAVTKWTKKTKEGKQEWERSCKDFNIGDLALCAYETGDLNRFLNECGVYNLNIVIDSFASDFVFDTVLCEG